MEEIASPTIFGPNEDRCMCNDPDGGTGICSNHGSCKTNFDASEIKYAYANIDNAKNQGDWIQWEIENRGTGEIVGTGETQIDFDPAPYEYICAWYGLPSLTNGNYIIHWFYDDGNVSWYMGATPPFTVMGGGAVGGIYYQTSSFYTGPFIPNANERVMCCNLYNDNYATKGDIFIKVCEHPDTPLEKQIDYKKYSDVEAGTSFGHDTYMDIPSDEGISWPLGVKVWGDSEEEPSFE